MTHFSNDAASRPLHLGNLAGGTTTQPYAATVSGVITNPHAPHRFDENGQALP